MVFFIFIQILISNSGEPDQTPRFVASDLVLHCLPSSHKKDLDLYGLMILCNYDYTFFFWLGDILRFRFFQTISHCVFSSDIQI